MKVKCQEEKISPNVQPKHEMKNEKRGNMGGKHRKVVKGWVWPLLHFSFQSAKLQRRVSYWLLALDVSKNTALLHIIVFTLFLSLLTWLETDHDQLNRQGKVSDRHPVLLMLQLFGGWLENINCCPSVTLIGWPRAIPLIPSQTSRRTKTHRTCPAFVMRSNPS